MKHSHSYAPTPVPSVPLAATRSAPKRHACAIRTLAAEANAFATGAKVPPTATAYRDVVALINALKLTNPQHFPAGVNEYSAPAILLAFTNRDTK